MNTGPGVSSEVAGTSHLGGLLGVQSFAHLFHVRAVAPDGFVKLITSDAELLRPVGNI